MVKIGSVELTDEEAVHMYEEHKYIVSYKRVFQLAYSAASGQIYGIKVYEVLGRETCGLTKRGRFFAMSASDVNHLLGFRLLNEML